MVMGENGIFGKANNAKNKTEIAQYEEELRMCVLELQTDAATNGETFNMETIKNKFVEKVKELENTTEIEFSTGESETRLDGTYKGYEFYIDDKYAAHIGDKATGISLTTSINPSGWTQGPVTATITIKSNNGINNVEPDEGSKNGNEYIITKTDIAENASFKYTVTDGQGNTQTKTAVINTIDKTAPEDFSIEAQVTEEGIQIIANPQDAEATETNACSGINKCEYYIVNDKNEEIKLENEFARNIEKGKYKIYVVAYDNAGNSKKSSEKECIYSAGNFVWEKWNTSTSLELKTGQGRSNADPSFKRKYSESFTAYGGDFQLSEPIYESTLNNLPLNSYVIYDVHKSVMLVEKKEYKDGNIYITGPVYYAAETLHKGETYYGYEFSKDEADFPSNGEKDGYWYIKIENK